MDDAHRAGQGRRRHRHGDGRPLCTDDWMADARITKEYAPLVRDKGIVAELVVLILSGGRWWKVSSTCRT